MGDLVVYNQLTLLNIKTWVPCGIQPNNANQHFIKMGGPLINIQLSNATQHKNG